MWKNLPFSASLICFSIILSGVKGQKNVKFLVLVEENAQMDLKAKLGDGLAKAQSSNAGFTFEMTPFHVVRMIFEYYSVVYRVTQLKWDKL